ncbi:hypothetical protein EJ04DRAFT_571071 [Polyplosphaeria fusca]|uniref:Uncharacterized protein n=1 Tax=Polyplosphaeria fusca TaxID=682080 RepID=A0A9P4QKZ6_9PLEO|nr:hypothetical protein EJ04DRAFT_571071 [Polyplosphaeria fusca]
MQSAALGGLLALIIGLPVIAITLAIVVYLDMRNQKKHPEKIDWANVYNPRARKYQHPVARLPTIETVACLEKVHKAEEKDSFQ